MLSCFGPEQRTLLYPKTSGVAEFREVLTGYIDRPTAEAHRPRIAPMGERPYDIVYRALKLPYWFGSHGALKHEIAVVVAEAARPRGLVTDISTRWEDTIYSGWLDFLGSGRTVIGVESGSSVLDRRGEIKAQIAAMDAERPGASFGEVDGRLPPGWDAYEFFAISPRHLEAVITKTCQVLIEGNYSGVLEADRHFIPLRRDFSNLPEVLDRIADHEALAAIAERAYEEVYLPGAHDLEQFANGLRALIPKRSSVVLPRAPVQRADTLAGDIRDAAGRASGRLASTAVRSARRARTNGVVRPTLRHTHASSMLPIAARGISKVPVAGTALRQACISALLMQAAIAPAPRRRLLMRYVADGAWRQVPPRALARDVFRIAVLDQLQAVSVDADGDSLVVKTHAGMTSPTAAQKGVYWDHSGAGEVVPITPHAPHLGSLRVGVGGVYRFDALSALQERYGELVREAIVPACADE